MRKGLVCIQLKNSTHLTWAFNKEIGVHAKVINCIDFSKDQVENKSFPQVPSINAACIEIWKNCADDC
jgi:hypothetical protein